MPKAIMKTRALDVRTSGEIERIRRGWAQLTNGALERAGADARVDHRSLEAQGATHRPTAHLGPTVTAMERRGQRTERGDLNRHIQEEDQARRELETLERQARDEAQRAHARQRRPEWCEGLEEARFEPQTEGMGQLGAYRVRRAHKLFEQVCAGDESVLLEAGRACARACASGPQAAKALEALHEILLEAEFAPTGRPSCRG